MEDVKFYIGGSGPVVLSETEQENAEDLFASDADTADIPLSDLQMLEKTIQSDQSYIRQASVHYVLNVLRLADAAVDDVQPAFNAVVRLSNDEEGVVRLELMRRIFEVAQCCNGRLEFQSAVYVYVLPVVVKLLCDCNAEVRRASREALLRIMKDSSVSQDYVESGIVPAAVQILDQDGPDELRAEGVLLMADVASCCSQITSENVFVPRLLHLCTDMLFQVRKACAVKFGEFCSAVRQEVAESLLLPKFASLTEDGVWGVRKACAESFVQVSLACSMSTRKTELVRIFLGLINDQSRWVRMAAYQSIGGFIASFADPSVTGLHLTEDQTVMFTDIVPNDFCPQPEEGCVNDGTANLPCEAQSGDAVETRCCTTVHDQAMGEHCLQTDDLKCIPAAEDSHIITCSRDTALSYCETEVPNVPDSTQHSTAEQAETDECYSDSSGSGMSDRTVIKLGVGDQHKMPSDDQVQPPAASSPRNETDVHASSTNSIDSDLTADLICSDSLSAESDRKSVAGYYHSGAVASISEEQNYREVIAAETVRASISLASDDVPKSDVSTSVSVSGQCSSVSSDSFKMDKTETEAVGKGSAARTILTASLNEVSLPVDETITHIGSTRVHVTDELSIVDGVVTPVESGVKVDVTQRPVTLSLKDDMTVESSVSLSSSDDLSQQVDSADAADLGNLSPLHMIRKDTLGFPPCGLLAYHAAEIPDEMLADNKHSVAAPDHPVSQQIVPQVLLDYYMSMTEPSRVQTVDCDIMYHCAYSLPAVVFTLGRDNWPYLSKLFYALSSSLQWKVRRTVAASLHCIAAAVGEEITDKDLMPVFNELLNDVDEVRTALVEHFADFIFLLPANARHSFLPRISDLLNVDNARNWRYRVDVTLHLFRLYEAYTVDEFCRQILPVVLDNLAHDHIAEVRCTAVGVLSGVLGKLSDAEDTERVDALAGELIEQFAHSFRWSRRQMYVSLCKTVFAQIMQASTLSRVAVDLVHQLLPPLLQLASDPVPNVRITLARCLAQHYANFAVCELGELEEATKAALTTLQNDADRDVCQATLSGLSSLPMQWHPVPDFESCTVVN